MKRFFYIVCIVLNVFITKAQIVIGTNNPDKSAELEVASTTKGFLPPRLTQAQRNNISSPTQGLLIYCTNCGTGEPQIFNGNTWVKPDGSAVTPAAPSPNFIVVFTDDQRYNTMGVNGNNVIITPNMDKLAAKGMQFTNANVAFALCSPSRAALLTGRYGSANGVLSLGSGFNEGEITLANYMRDAGYVTGLSGKWHINQLPQDVGFDFYSYCVSNGPYYNRRVFNQSGVVFPSNHIDEYGVQKSIEFIEEQASKNNPFFLFHCPQTPHLDGRLIWDAQESTKQMYDVNDMPVPTNRLDDLSNKPAYLKTVRNLTKAKDYGYPDFDAIQSHTRDYYSVITELDSFLGDLFDRVEELGLMENTYIIFMGDNGWMLGDHGFTSKVLPYEPSTHVPFWVAGPDITPTTNTSMVSNLDILPTIMELAKINLPNNIHGKSIKPVLLNETTKVRDYFIYEGLGIFGDSQYNLTVITDEFRYIVTYTNASLQTVEFRELYDQVSDELEMNNLINDPNYTALIAEMDLKIQEFIQNN